MKKLSRSCSSWVGEAGSELGWGGRHSRVRSLEEWLATG